MYTKKCDYREFPPHFYNSSRKPKKSNDYNGLRDSRFPRERALSLGAAGAEVKKSTRNFETRANGGAPVVYYK